MKDIPFMPPEIAPHSYVAAKHCGRCRALYQRVYRIQRMKMPDAIKLFERLLGLTTKKDSKAQTELEAKIGAALEG